MTATTQRAILHDRYGFDHSMLRKMPEHIIAWLYATWTKEQ